MRLELPMLNTRVDVFVGPNPDATGPFYYWPFSPDAAAQFLQIILIGAGGGGGSGRQGDVATIRGGGQGGAGGAYHTGFYPAWMLGPGNIYNVLAGAGGPGGAAIDTVDTSGNGGTDGKASGFHNLVQANGGRGGDPGYRTMAADAYGVGAYTTPWPGGGGGGTNTNAIWHNGQTGLAGGGGGGGAWYDAADGVHDGGSSGMSSGLQSRTGFASAGQDGQNQPENWPLPSCGGGGGHVGGNGGVGGFYGGGGGGGGASLNGTPSGGGGAGANGIVVITQYF
jgi:hypothetical protein